MRQKHMTTTYRRFIDQAEVLPNQASTVDSEGFTSQMALNRSKVLIFKTFHSTADQLDYYQKVGDPKQLLQVFIDLRDHITTLDSTRNIVEHERLVTIVFDILKRRFKNLDQDSVLDTELQQKLLDTAGRVYALLLARGSFEVAIAEVQNLVKQSETSVMTGVTCCILANLLRIREEPSLIQVIIEWCETEFRRKSPIAPDASAINFSSATDFVTGWFIEIIARSLENACFAKMISQQTHVLRELKNGLSRIAQLKEGKELLLQDILQCLLRLKRAGPEAKTAFENLMDKLSDEITTQLNNFEPCAVSKILHQNRITSKYSNDLCAWKASLVELLIDIPWEELARWGWNKFDPAPYESLYVQQIATKFHKLKHPWIIEVIRTTECSEHRKWIWLGKLYGNMLRLHPESDQEEISKVMQSDLSKISFWAPAFGVACLNPKFCHDFVNKHLPNLVKRSKLDEVSECDVKLLVELLISLTTQFSFALAKELLLMIHKVLRTAKGSTRELCVCDLAINLFRTKPSLMKQSVSEVQFYNHIFSYHPQVASKLLACVISTVGMAEQVGTRTVLRDYTPTPMRMTRYDLKISGQVSREAKKVFLKDGQYPHGMILAPVDVEFTGDRLSGPLLKAVHEIVGNHFPQASVTTSRFTLQRNGFSNVDILCELSLNDTKRLASTLQDGDFPANPTEVRNWESDDEEKLYRLVTETYGLVKLKDHDPLLKWYFEHRNDLDIRPKVKRVLQTVAGHHFRCQSDLDAATETFFNLLEYSFAPKPENPMELTGVSNIGELLKYGPNEYIYVVILYLDKKTGKLFCLTCARATNKNERTIPSDFRRVCGGSPSRNELLDVLGSEVLKSIPPSVRTLILSGDCNRIHVGNYKDPRNTDNAWVEPNVYCFECDNTQRDEIDKNSDDAYCKEWTDVTMLHSMKSEKMFVEKAARVFRENLKRTDVAISYIACGGKSFFLLENETEKFPSVCARTEQHKIEFLDGMFAKPWSAISGNGERHLYEGAVMFLDCNPNQKKEINQRCGNRFKWKEFNAADSHGDLKKELSDQDVALMVFREEEVVINELANQDDRKDTKKLASILQCIFPNNCFERVFKALLKEDMVWNLRRHSPILCHLFRNIPDATRAATLKECLQSVCSMTDHNAREVEPVLLLLYRLGIIDCDFICEPPTSTVHSGQVTLTFEEQFHLDKKRIFEQPDEITKDWINKYKNRAHSNGAKGIKKLLRSYSEDALGESMMKTLAALAKSDRTKRMLLDPEPQDAADALTTLKWLFNEFIVILDQIRDLSWDSTKCGIVEDAIQFLHSLVTFRSHSELVESPNQVPALHISKSIDGVQSLLSVISFNRLLWLLEATRSSYSEILARKQPQVLQLIQVFLRVRVIAGASGWHVNIARFIRFVEENLNHDQYQPVTFQIIQDLISIDMKKVIYCILTSNPKGAKSVEVHTHHENMCSMFVLPLQKHNDLAKIQITCVRMLCEVNGLQNALINWVPRKVNLRFISELLMCSNGTTGNSLGRGGREMFQKIWKLFMASIGDHDSVNHLAIILKWTCDPTEQVHRPQKILWILEHADVFFSPQHLRSTSVCALLIELLQTKQNISFQALNSSSCVNTLVKIATAHLTTEIVCTEEREIKEREASIADFFNMLCDFLLVCNENKPLLRRLLMLVMRVQEQKNVIASEKFKKILTLAQEIFGDSY